MRLQHTALKGPYLCDICSGIMSSHPEKLEMTTSSGISNQDGFLACQRYRTSFYSYVPAIKSEAQEMKNSFGKHDLPKTETYHQGHAGF